MALRIDAQVLAQLGPLLEAIGETKSPPIGDVETRRVNGHRMFDYGGLPITPRSWAWTPPASV
jgi:hypothetical protein